MRLIVLINNFNYADFLLEALCALKMQSKPADKIIIVDDGSTDDSPEVLRRLEKDECITVISKKNGGQLSCFNAVAGAIDDDDLVYFLDSDDIYPPDYIESVLHHIEPTDDMVFASAALFSNGLEDPIGSCKRNAGPPILIKKSSSLTRKYQCQIGSPTSSIVLRGSAFNKIFPYHDEPSWITRADDIIVFSASILGLRKKKLPSIAIAYRVHGRNNFHGKEISQSIKMARMLAIDKLFLEMSRRAGISAKASTVAAYYEALFIPYRMLSGLHISTHTNIRFVLFAKRAFSLFGKVASWKINDDSGFGIGPSGG